MPKPTFMQSVLRKPTRSYADPYAPSPWSDHSGPSNDYYEPPASRYTPRIDDGVHLGYRERDGPEEAGPSSIRRRQLPVSTAGSTVSDSHRSSVNRFPRAARKAQSTISLREAAIVTQDEYGREEPVRSGTVKKKKKKPQQSQGNNRSEAGSSILESEIATSPTSSLTPTETHVRPKQKRATSSSTTVSSTANIPKPPPLQPRSADESSSSTASSPIPPLSPTVSSHLSAEQIQSRPRPALSMVQKSLQSNVAPPLTPPSSDRSSSTSIKPRSPAPAPAQSRSTQPSVTIVPPPPKPAKSPKRLSVTSINESESEEEAFYTPRASLDSLRPDADAASPVELSLPVIQAVELPSLRFQPPTPAPIADPDTSPFGSLPSSSNSSSLHPDDQRTPRPRDQHQSTWSSSASTDSPLHSSERAQAHEVVDEDLDAHSATGEAGSDDDEESERLGGSHSPSGHHSRTSSFARPKSRNGSRTPSVTLSSGIPASEGRRPLSRQSTTRQSTRNSFDDFVVRRNSPPASQHPAYASERAPSRAGSVHSGISGHGKGGWAAAAAASRSGATTPVAMFMPQSGNDGWAAFQQPPPRQSRFTPLPQPAQPKTFNNIVHGREGQDGSAPSSYSQESDEEEDELPKPSRSYARQDYRSESGYSDSRSQASIPRSEDRFETALRKRQMDLNNGFDPYNDDGPISVPSPQQHSQTLARLTRSASQRLPSQSSGRSQPYSPYDFRPTSPVPPPSSDRPSSRAGYDTPSYQRRASQPALRPQSPDDFQRPTSPPPRPSSRIGFEPPSFLNPDTITLLPEMTQEDSARTYAPSEPARPPRRSASVFGGFSRHAKSEMFGWNADNDDEDNDNVPELPARRSKSALGYRAGDTLSQWGGSSAGEGVLMESHGRGPESVSGYTNLILPAGAYKPSDPARTASEINSRVLGLPHATMASIVLTTLPHKDTPIHLRDQNPPVDFSSHLKPPTRLGSAQVLLQVYAVAIDEMDVRALDEKGRWDIGKWVPGRSFVGRCLSVGAEEKEIVRGDILIGLVDIRKSGVLSEYILCDRRRVARAPFPTSLSLEQLSALPLQGIPAARAVRTHLTRHTRALIVDAHKGIPALVCQEMSRAGVNVTAVISGGDGSHEAQGACMANGARGVLTGSPAAVMMGLDESGWDFIMDSWGGQRVYDAARRILKDGGKLITLVEPNDTTTISPMHPRSSGLKSLRAAFGSKRKDSKMIKFEYLPPAGSGEPEVDASGVDCRDVLEEMCMSYFRPVVRNAVPFEKGAEVFRGRRGGRVGADGREEKEAGVIRLIN